MANITTEHLIAGWKRLQAKDPLFAQGIGFDWVCVIHPAMERPLLDEFDRMYDEPDNIITNPGWKLSRMTGRETYILDAAPLMKYAYMTREKLQELYGQYLGETSLPILDYEENLDV